MRLVGARHDGEADVFHRLNTNKFNGSFAILTLHMAPIVLPGAVFSCDPH